MYKFAAIALFASAVLAQIPGLPSCAQSCITDYGGCNQIDVKCICSNNPLLEKLSCCVSLQCDEEGTAAVIKFADTLCGSYGVTTLPTAATCVATGTATSTTAVATGTTTESATMSMTSAPTSVSSAMGSAASMASTAASSAAAAAPTHMAQKVLGMGLGAAGLFAVL
ncbi:uncharacterized protein SEPMUDRAFT_151026 [Sphaerulina musiva SO2202]|uniref:CFEM domain-containing protein n=1 Tax=Sphaerulina musiva (strain SO2202) TaxID=692275 RepID=M3CBZ8_SPHMS|nr:uncharacterized protein SEPMUDRAFT_151026 [Sphaerulina musiva SO2202]EMF09932.1 hypothetical protein SEPMUDRAFT_151026 [Sphaerulina musiva SO2202]